MVYTEQEILKAVRVVSGKNRLADDIVRYCNMNSLDTSKFVSELIRKSFMIEKYGERPLSLGKKQEINDDTPEECEEQKPIIATYEFELEKTKKRTRTVKKKKEEETTESEPIEEKQTKPRKRTLKTL